MRIASWKKEIQYKAIDINKTKNVKNIISLPTFNSIIVITTYNNEAILFIN